MKTRITITILLLILLPGTFFTSPPGAAQSKKLRLEWEDVEGAVKYEVQIKNQSNKIVVREVVTSPSIAFSLTPGKYRLRIGSINKFNKVGSWSDWEPIEIKKSRPKTIFKSPESYGNMRGFRVSIGPNYYKIQSAWQDVYETSSFTGFSLYGGYSFWFFRFAGVEVETSYISLKGVENPNTATASANLIISGINIYGTTNLNFPLNLYVRLGGGIVYSTVTYELKSSTSTIEEGSISSRDPYYKAGISLEYRFSRSFHFEAGLDYYTIKYLEKDMQTMKYYGLIGMRF